MYETIVTGGDKIWKTHVKIRCFSMGFCKVFRAKYLEMQTTDVINFCGETRILNSRHYGGQAM